MASYRMILGYPGFNKLIDEPPEEGQNGILLCPRASVLDITVNLATVWVEIGLMLRGQGSGFGSVDWQGALPFTPVRMSLPERVDAVRVWRFSSAGEEPQVAIKAR